MKIKCEVSAIATEWQIRRATQIETSMPASSPEISDEEDDPMMESGSDGTVLGHPDVHVGLTMEQAHFNVAMAKE
ncbi:NHL repeat-containing protein 2 [Hordeum vulgare]|nr:NHL repeat-containing protein 2 [Hordeum vulgare]